MQTELADINVDPRFDPLVPLEEGPFQDQWAGDDKLFIQFYKRPVINPSKSTAAGRSVYDEKDYIIIRTPGSQLSVVESRVVGTKYEKRFAKQYAAWKADQNVAQSGTPLEAFPFLVGKVGLIAELKYLNIQTVEQLASVSDGGLQSFMGGFELRKRAQEWLESTTGTDAQLATLAEENAKLKARLDALEVARSEPAQTPQFLKQGPAKKA